MNTKKIKSKIYEVIFGTSTRLGKLWDVALLWFILISVLVVIVDSVPSIPQSLRKILFYFEWFFTISFTIEYILRIWVTRNPIKYVRSVWGIIDLISFIPTYISIFLIGYHYLLIIRILRLLRIFRILRLTRFTKEGRNLLESLRTSIYKLGIFISFIITVVLIMGTIMYVVEGEENGFSSIPQSVYWAIVTITTVGYGDLVPNTVVGKVISSVAMLIGYVIIAIPTGIVTVEFSKRKKIETPNQTPSLTCRKCQTKNLEIARYCYFCGNNLKA